MSSNIGLFSGTLISSKAQEALPEGYFFRALQRSDFKHGHLDVLRGLAHVGEIEEDQWTERYDFMNKCNGTYFVVVIIDKNQPTEKMIIGTGTLVIEKKFLHNLGVQGHIEDVAIAEDQRGKRLGVVLIQALDYISEQEGCYKTILDCDPEKEGFYIKCGYERRGLEMHHYHDAEAQKHGV